MYIRYACLSRRCALVCQRNIYICILDCIRELTNYKDIHSGDTMKWGSLPFSACNKHAFLINLVRALTVCSEFQECNEFLLIYTILILYIFWPYTPTPYGMWCSLLIIICWELFCTHSSFHLGPSYHLIPWLAKCYSVKSAFYHFMAAILVW